MSNGHDVLIDFKSELEALPTACFISEGLLI